MQSNIVKAFRQRLIRDGYSFIRIYGDHYGLKFYVYCISPDGKNVACQLSEDEMKNLPRRVYFSAGDYKT